MIKNLLLLFISTTLILVICEIAIRLFLPQISDHDVMFQFDQELGWGFIPDKKGSIVYDGVVNHTIQINQDGFRDIPFQDKTNDTKIMVIGDSFVSNISVDQNEVFTQVIENKLENTSVYNFGVNGYGQVQEYLLLKKWVPKIQPDLIVVMVYLRNDFTDNVSANPWLYNRPSVVFVGDDQIKILPPSEEQHVGRKLPFYYDSHLFRLVRSSVSNIQAKASKDISVSHTPTEITTCRIPMTDEAILMYKTLERLLVAMNMYGETIHTPILFALAPSIFHIQDDLWSQIVAYDPSLVLQRDLTNTTLLAFAEAKQISMIDLTPAILAAHSNGAKMYNPKEQHWTAEGNKIVADVLIESMQSYLVINQDSL